VLLPHGGPEARDYFGYDAFAQFLASRGDVVVQPHFRGSIGSGRAFGNAGRGQWGQLMQHDLTDAVRHMVETNIADPAKVCIVGASYGGYAALAGVAFTPELYRCAVAIAAPSDLIEVLSEERRNSGSAAMNYQYWLRSIGDPRTDRERLIAASPARSPERITAPLLLIHGETDETVPIRQSQLMMQAMSRVGRPARLIRLEDSDHFWDRWSMENRLVLFRETEAFLAQHLQ
jgi:dipeptidyl aminopeptidase/acylaminoacyl peptidase